MQIVCTYNEFSAQVNMLMTVAKAMPSGIGSDMLRDLQPLQDAVQDINDFDFSEESIKYAKSDSSTRSYVADNGAFVIEYDEQKFIKVTEAITDEVDFLVGIGVTIAGLLMTFKARAKKFGDKIIKITQED